MGAMNYHEALKSNNILKTILVICIMLIVSVWVIYRPLAWPLGKETAFCLLSLILISAILFILWTKEKILISDQQKKNVAFGLCFGLFWTIEISINNIIRPGLPFRDLIDNIFWAFIAISILVTAAYYAFNSNMIVEGIKSGFWSGLASGAVACLTALLMIVFGMKFILLDPLNIKEWSDLKESSGYSGMSVYFAYQTFAGALGHLFVLGIVMGVILGTIGGLFGKIGRRLLS